jgi:hypothetical protein
MNRLRGAATSCRSLSAETDVHVSAVFRKRSFGWKRLPCSVVPVESRGGIESVLSVEGYHRFVTVHRVAKSNVLQITSYCKRLQGAADARPRERRRPFVLQAPDNKEDTANAYIDFNEQTLMALTPRWFRVLSFKFQISIYGSESIFVLNSAHPRRLNGH